MSLIATTPQSIGQVLDSGFQLYRACLPKLFPLTLAAGIASALPQMAEEGGTQAAVFVVTFVASMLLFVAAIRRLNDVASGRPVMSLGEAISGSWGLVLPMLLVIVLYALALAGGFLLLIVPGVILMVSLAFAGYGLVLDRLGIIESLRTSHRLVWGHWWRTAVIMTVVSIIFIAFYAIVFAVAGVLLAIGGQEQAGFGTLLGYLAVTALVSAVMQPLLYSVALVVYRDLQLRKSGTDLEARIAATA